MKQLTDWKIYEQCLQSLQSLIWVIDNQNQIVVQSKGAQELELDYDVPILKIFDSLNGQCCPIHAFQEKCQECPVEYMLDPTGIPLQLRNQMGNFHPFWGNIQLLGEYRLLELRSWRDTQQAQQERLMLSYLNAAQETERKRIARDLHDGLAQSIYCVMLETRRLVAKYHLEQQTAFRQLDVNFGEVLQEVRSMAAELYPASLDDLGLLPAIFHLRDQLQHSTGFRVAIRVTGQPFTFSKHQVSNLYRIIQEALNNTMKYSGENTAEVLFQFASEVCTIKITDKGDGFIPKQQSEGFGLLNMSERAHSLGADFQCISAIHKGTTISVTVAKMEESS